MQCFTMLKFFTGFFYLHFTSKLLVLFPFFKIFFFFCSVPTDKQSQEQATNKIINEQMSQLLLLNLTIANNS